MATVQALVDELLEGVDATSAQALRWINRRHQQMAAHAKTYRAAVTVTTTVGDQRDYTLPTNVIEVLELSVDDLPYSKGRHTDLVMGALGYVALSGQGGIFVEEASSAGAREIALYPTPTVSGDTILAYAALLPADITTATDQTALFVDLDMVGELVVGAKADALMMSEDRLDMAATLEQRFQGAAERMRRRQERRLRGAGPAMIRVQGINA